MSSLQKILGYFAKASLLASISLYPFSQAQSQERPLDIANNQNTLNTKKTESIDDSAKYQMIASGVLSFGFGLYLGYYGSKKKIKKTI